MTILVDMDDVLELLVAGWVEYINERHGTRTKPEDIKEWAMEKGFPSLTREQVYAATRDDALWDYVKPMPGADEVLRKLIERGHEIFVVTATGFETLRAKMEKVLFKYYPYLTWNHVIITEHKELIRGDILVDDGPHNFTKDRGLNLLYSAGHNQWFDEKEIDAIRVNNWDEVYEEIIKYEAAVAKA